MVSQMLKGNEGYWEIDNLRDTGQEQQGKSVRVGGEEQLEETRAENADEPEVTGRPAEVRTSKGSEGLVQGGDERYWADETSRSGKGKGNGGKGEHEGKGGEEVRGESGEEENGETRGMRWAEEIERKRRKRRKSKRKKEQGRRS